MKTDAQYTDESSRVRVRKRHSDDGDGEEVVLRGREKFKIDSYLPIIDKLHAELFHRMKAYDNVYSIFGFLTEFPLKTDDEIKEAARRFSENYREDIETEFINEMVHFKYFISQVDELKADETVPALRSYKLIYENKVESTFPNVMTALKIYRCLMVTNATGERTFSKLKLLKNCHRSSMTQERLNSLAIMTTENDILQKTDFKDILLEFTAKKLRRVNM